MNKLQIAKNDIQFEDCRVESFNNDVASFEDGCLSIKNELGAPPIKAGDTLRLFGKGIGYTIRGVGRVENGELASLYRYQTEAEEVTAHARWREDEKVKKLAVWATELPETMKRIKALPEAFQKRIEFFMRDPAWGPEFGPYEIFCCEEAVKIFNRLKTKDAIAAFRVADSAKQEELVPDLDYDKHSGNTFSAAVTLALVAARDLELVPKMHGALCPLVGCANYGCYSTTKENYDNS